MFCVKQCWHGWFRWWELCEKGWGGGEVGKSGEWGFRVWDPLFRSLLLLWFPDTFQQLYVFFLCLFFLGGCGGLSQAVLEWLGGDAFHCTLTTDNIPLVWEAQSGPFASFPIRFPALTVCQAHGTSLSLMILVPPHRGLRTTSLTVLPQIFPPTVSALVLFHRCCSSLEGSLSFPRRLRPP